MTTFESVHESRIAGKLVAFDRLIFKGHLNGWMPEASPQIIPKISRKTACSRTMRSKAVMRGWSQSSRIVGMQSYQ